ncbi:hypothetical protein AB0J25_02455 [Streptomyces sp. NPDC049910]|uniref:hypothetical protein n=1 Tax=Streptomyces sp. NPDC049910 TaxID=3155278 RepID=UPI0034226DDC
MRTDDLGEWISSIANRAWTRQIAAGDFSGDGKADLLAPRNADTFCTYTGNGTGNFAAPVITQP